ncbi:MAG: CCA tRNA nucleotidyltransferase, partial [Pseudomonadota bacterium]
AATVSARFKHSNDEAHRLLEWSKVKSPAPETDRAAFKQQLYWADQQAMVDALRLEVVHLRGRDDQTAANHIAELAKTAEGFRRPVFPVQGRDLLDLGMAPGKAVGERLRQLEKTWVESGFHLSREELLAAY